MKELTASWNRRARVGLTSETAQGWLKKTEQKRNDQNCLLQIAVPGVKALKEIQFYQGCQTFLVSILPFQRLVWEISHNYPFSEESMRWQAKALFVLQSAMEAYMTGFYNDVSKCAYYRKVKMINHKDIFLTISIHGREYVGGWSQVADVGAANVSGVTVVDSSKKKVALRGKKKAFTKITDWCAELRAAVTIDTGLCSIYFPIKVPKIVVLVCASWWHKVSRNIKFGSSDMVPKVIWIHAIWVLKWHSAWLRGICQLMPSDQSQHHLKLDPCQFYLSR